MAEILVAVQGEEEYEYRMDEQTLRRVLNSAIFHLDKCRRTDKDKFPRADRLALEMAERIRADFRLW